MENLNSRIYLTAMVNAPSMKIKKINQAESLKHLLRIFETTGN
jgi:hypothetical protein